MRRREFLLVAGGAASSPLLQLTQQPAKLPTIGYLGPDTPSIDTYRFLPSCSACANWAGSRVKPSISNINGRREAESSPKKSRSSSSGERWILSSRRRPRPPWLIVFAAVGDPVGTGLVASLARPGGNATGLSLQQTDAAGKRLELLREAIPGIRRLAILANGGNLSALLDMREAQAMAQTAGFEAVSSEIRDQSTRFEVAWKHCMYVTIRW